MIKHIFQYIYIARCIMFRGLTNEIVVNAMVEVTLAAAAPTHLRAGYLLARCSHAGPSPRTTVPMTVYYVPDSTYT